ncbi:hypothetical protein D9757_004824 [Collybiopsis confluens]|uniref:C2H2-type domain-containing protein n=1 Tax=Collybiopsis confluens TaxID=2823264 RepID=A0A8H5HT10_9AGAR|nr:hypothetical protein D9757_004824 [Collybiopsis confluens]
MHNVHQIFFLLTTDPTSHLEVTKFHRRRRRRRRQCDTACNQRPAHTMSTLANAHGFTFSSVAGDQNINHHHNYAPPSPFTIRIESALDSRPIGSQWRYQPHPLPSPTDPSLPHNARYSLLLLAAKQGYPLWRPEPNRRLPEQYRRTGLPIGSVGIIRPDGFFDYLFNICFPKDNPVNVGGVPEDFKPVEFSQTDVSEIDPFLDPDAHIASPNLHISKTLVHSDGLNYSHLGMSRAYEFASENPEGAILMLPDGSTRIDLENKRIFRQYATRNAHRWFTYVEEARGRESEDLSLYIITGSDRSSSFGVASFLNMQDQEFRLRFNIDNQSHSYAWSRHHYADSRTGPRFVPGDPLAAERPVNQDVFLRGFKINRRQRAKGKESSVRVEPIASTSNAGRNNFPGGPLDPKQNGGENVEVEYIPGYPPPYHPCDTVNAFMLELLSATPGTVGSGPSFAISHDDDWRAVWDESNPKLPSEEELIRRICAKSKFVVDNGMLPTLSSTFSTIYCDPVDDPAPRKSLSILPDEAVTARVLVIFTCPVQNCGEQFQQQALLITHMQQKHDVVHGTAARVPLSAAKALSGGNVSKPPSQPGAKKRRGGVAALSCAVEHFHARAASRKVVPRYVQMTDYVAAQTLNYSLGSLTTGKGNRFVLANTDELQGKIEELTARAQVLEDALTKSHSLVSPQPHPLLSDDLLQIKRSIKEESPEPSLSITTATIKEENEEERADEALTTHNSCVGSLYIGERSTFYGRSATSWHFLLNENGIDQERPQKQPIERPIPTDLPWLAYSFPFAPRADHSTRQRLVEHLPKPAVARRHYQNYFRYATWQYDAISEIDFRQTIFQPIYEPHADDHSFEDPLSSHKLAILFLIFALGALLDFDGQAHSPEAKWYYQLGRAALSLESVLDSPAMSTIQALILLSYYMLLDDIHDPRWSMMGLTTKLSQTAGLHIDGTHWNLSPEETHRRRCLFWEIYSYDLLQSLTYGRPPHMALVHIDTKHPFETTRDVNGDMEMTYAAWKHKFFSECLGIIWNKAFGAHPLNYEELKRLDQEMRAYYVPPSLRVPGFGGAKLNQDVHPPSAELTMARHFLVALKEITSFYMHRGFFATAMNENPDNPIEHHRYGESVQTIFDSACICVGLMRSLYRHQAKIMQRFSYFFDHIFSCSFVLGAIASKPQIPLALTALTNLELAYDLLEAHDHPRSPKILAEIGKLRDQARQALNVKHNILTNAQKLSRPKPTKTDVRSNSTSPIRDRQQSSWGGGARNNVPLLTTSPTSPSSQHQYSPTISYPQLSTYNTHPSSYAVDQYSTVFTPTSAGPQTPQSALPNQYSDPFYEHPDMAYNPMSGYQYHDYQEAGYFQQQMQQEVDYQSTYDASGDVVMPMVMAESWQTFMNHIRQ